MLTRAERKEYPSGHSSTPIDLEVKPNGNGSKSFIDEEGTAVLPKTEPLSLTTSSPPSPEKLPSPPPPPEPAVRCSVIKRTPSTSAATTIVVPGTSAAVAEKIKGSVVKDIKPVPLLVKQHIEPEQDQPIDYHVPKQRPEFDEEQEKRTREARRNSAIISRSHISMRQIVRGLNGKVNGIMVAAAGHGRSNGSSQGGNTNQASGQNCGGSINFNGSAASGGSVSGGAAGGIGGGTGAGGGMGGRDGRSNYGPNSPPTGSLPPFYESLKAGNNGMNAYNANNGNGYMSGTGNSSYNHLMNSMDCDGSQDLTNIGSYSDTNHHQQNGTSNSQKQYSMLQNAAYGIVLKDEQDLEYDSKMDPLSLHTNIMQNSYNGYDVNDGMMVDMNGSVVDPLQFTATLTFSSPAEHALLDSLSDAVDLSSFLQRLPNDDHSSSGNDLELSSTPSLTPDSVSITPVDNNHHLEPYTDHMLMGGGGGGRNSYERNGYLSSKMYHENPPSYHQSSREMTALMQSQQDTNHQLVSNATGFDFDQHSNMSLPSPSGTSSLDGSTHDGSSKRSVQQSVGL